MIFQIFSFSKETLLTKMEALRMTELDLECKIILHTEIIDLANRKSIPDEFCYGA